MLIKIKVNDLKCPTCGSGEMHPDGQHLLVRGFKVHSNGHWWSQCLVCAGYYDEQLNVGPLKDPTAPLLYENHPAAFNKEKGWF